MRINLNRKRQDSNVQVRLQSGNDTQPVGIGGWMDFAIIHSIHGYYPQKAGLKILARCFSAL